MFRKLESKLSKSFDEKIASPFWGRFAVVAAGVVCIGYGLLLLSRGIFAFTSFLWRQTIFSASFIGTGILLILLAFLPSGKWVYRRITTIPTQTDKRKLTLDEEFKASRLKRRRRHSHPDDPNKL